MSNYIHIDRVYDWTGYGAGPVHIKQENEYYVAFVRLNPKLQRDENTFALDLLCIH